MPHDVQALVSNMVLLVREADLQAAEQEMTSLQLDIKAWERMWTKQRYQCTKAVTMVGKQKEELEAAAFKLDRAVEAGTQKIAPDVFAWANKCYCIPVVRYTEIMGAGPWAPRCM